VIVYGRPPSPARGVLRTLSTLCIAAGIVLVLSPFGWIAYTAVAAGPTQTAALAAWEDERAVAGAPNAHPAGMLLTIPALDLKRFVPDGATPDHLRRFGVGRIAWTALPEEAGLLGIAGHRTTYGAPFFRLDRLRRGDVIFVEYQGRRYRYAVWESQVVTPERVDILNSGLGERGIALVTCTPAFSAAYRLVVIGTLRGVSPAPAP
jgi:sortase A